MKKIIFVLLVFLGIYIYPAEFWFKPEFEYGSDSNVFDEPESISDVYSAFKIKIDSYLKIKKGLFSWLEYDYIYNRYLRYSEKDYNLNRLMCKFMHKTGKNIEESCYLIYTVYEQPQWQIFSMKNFNIQPLLKTKIGDYDIFKLFFSYEINSYPFYTYDNVSYLGKIDWTHEFDLFVKTDLIASTVDKAYTEKYIYITTETVSDKNLKAKEYVFCPILTIYSLKWKVEFLYKYTIYKFNTDLNITENRYFNFDSYFSNEIGIYPNVELDKNVNFSSEVSYRICNYNTTRKDNIFTGRLNLIYTILRSSKKDIRFMFDFTNISNKSTDPFYSYNKTESSLSLILSF